MRLADLIKIELLSPDAIIKEYRIPEMAAGDEKEISQEEWDEAMKLMKDHNDQADKDIKGFYYIDVTGRWEVYFTLWRWKDIDPRFAAYIKNPIYMGNQTTNFLTSVKKALNRIPKAAPFQIMTDQNREGLIGRNAARSNEALKFTFGKYRGRSLGEVYLENPGYFAWLAKNQDPRYAGSKMGYAIQTFAQMYYEEVTKQNTEKFKDVQYVGKDGERYEGEVEVYKIDKKQGQSFSYHGKPQMYTIAKATDDKGNKFIITNLDKAFPNHEITKGVKVKIKAKVTGNIEILGNKFNKLGYVKGIDPGNAPKKVDPYQQQPVSVNQPAAEPSPLSPEDNIKNLKRIYEIYKANYKAYPELFAWNNTEHSEWFFDWGRRFNASLFDSDSLQMEKDMKQAFDKMREIGVAPILSVPSSTV